MNAQTPFSRHLPDLFRNGMLLLLLCGPGQVAHATGITSPDDLIGATRGFLEQSVNNYLQDNGIEGRHGVEVSRLDPRLRLAGCPEALEAKLESPAQPVGRVTVRVSCRGPSPWSVFVPAQVRLYRQVLVANRALKRDSILGAADVTLSERDVGLLSQGYLTSLEQALGNKVTRAILPDQVLVPSQLQLAEVVRKGDQVVLSARSGSISVRMPGEALGDGAPGQQIRVKNQRSGRVVKARVMGPGQVEVSM